MHYAFTTRNELKAAAELREAGFPSFALMRMDRRRSSRHAKGKPTMVSRPVVALRGYVFADVDRPHLVASLRHVGQPVRFCGRWQPIPARELGWLMDPPGGMFHDTDIPRYANRPAPPVVNRGDTVTTTLAGESIKGEVLEMSTDGETLLISIRRLIFGLDRIRVPVSMIEVAA